MSAEVRIVVQIRQSNGEWRDSAAIPLDDEKRKTVCGWVSGEGLNFWPEPTAAEPVFAESEPVTDEELWSLSDDDLRRTLEGEDGLVAGAALAAYLPDFDGAIIQRFGQPLLFDLLARQLDQFGLDGDAFLNLPPAMQQEFIAGFTPGAPLPVMH